MDAVSGLKAMDSANHAESRPYLGDEARSTADRDGLEMAALGKKQTLNVCLYNSTPNAFDMFMVSSSVALAFSQPSALRVVSLLHGRAFSCQSAQVPYLD
jgi:hypothetical protein